MASASSGDRKVNSSILPSVPTNLTVIMVAEHIYRHALARWASVAGRAWAVRGSALADNSAEKGCAG
jgi:hypothetical protein